MPIGPAFGFGTHTGVCTGSQTFPHPPQLCGSLVRSMHVVPPLHVVETAGQTHPPWTQTFPHEPQLFESLTVSAHDPSRQVVSPATQTQLLTLHVWLEAQTFVQPP